MKPGFSLVELSIVLVILGLLTGGILAGQSLIRASELRAATVELQRYTTATNAFADKYFAVPGEFRDATRFWGRQATSECDTNSGAAVVATGTCDGNGDGAIYWCDANQATCEEFQFWRHLQLAGLIEGQYTGMSAEPIGPGAYNTALIGTNIPPSKLSGAGWGIAIVAGGGGLFGQGAFPTLKDVNGFLLGGNENVAAGKTGFNRGFVLTPSDAWNIDTKLDDGLPATGKVTANYDTGCVNIQGTNGISSTYLLTSSSISCWLIFPKPWR